MIELCAIMAVLSTVLACWLFYRNSLLKDENEFLYDDNRRQFGEICALRDQLGMDAIHRRTSEFYASAAGLSGDHSPDPAYTVQDNNDSYPR